VTALHRMLWRDLARIRGQAVAIGLLVACAAATFVASVTTWRALERSQQSLYDVFLFPHVFAEVRRAPEGLARSAAALPGVADVETRVLSEAVVEVPGLAEPASAMLRSLPPGGEPRLDRLHVREGRLPDPGESSAVLVSEGFARANRLGPGDRVSAVVNGRWKSLRVVGIGGSPEHLFAVRPGTLLNDDRHYGVIWMSRDELAAALDLTGAFNSIALRLAPGAKEAPAIEGLDRLLAPYGNRGAYGRDRQISNRLVTDEIGQMRALASTVPVVMLGVASFLLAIVLSRLVATQRMQIGTLKALGYGNGRVGVHYLAFASLLVAGGVVAGVAGGYGLGRWLSGVYARYYRFPAILYEAEPGVGILAAAIALAVALAAASGAVRRAVRLAPAEAMRPGAPPTFRPSPLERLGLGRVLTARGRMVLRDLGRRPVRTALSALGIAAAVACTMVAAFTRDASWMLVEHEFSRVAREDVAVYFTEALSEGALRELRALPGVVRGEGFRSVPAALRSGPRSHRTAVLGLEPGASLHRVYGLTAGAVEVPPAGLVLSRRLAGRLGVRVGDPVRVEVQEGRRPVADVRVARLVDDIVGVQAVMERSALDRIAGEGARFSGAFLQTDAAASGALNDRLRRLPKVAGIVLTGATRAAVVKMLDDSLVWFTNLLTGFSVLIAIGVVYNGARLALGERERELATLRVVGFTRQEVWRITASELGVQVLAGIPLGWLAGWGFVELTAWATESELMRLPPLVTPANCAVAAGVVAASAALVALRTRRWLGRLDLVSVLKAKE